MGVELVLSSGLSLGIPRSEIKRMGFQSLDQFADCLELGASFPTISFSIQVLKDPKPLWLGKATRWPRPPKPARPADAGAAGAAVEPESEEDSTPKATPEPMPLPPTPTYYPYRHGGGRSI